MRHGLGCSAVNCIVVHQYKPTFLVIPAYCRRKTKAMLPPIFRFIRHWKRYGRVVQELSRLSERELADIGIALRHRPYRKGAVPPVGRQATTAIRIL